MVCVHREHGAAYHGLTLAAVAFEIAADKAALVLEECECESAGRDKSFFGSIVLSVGECAFRTFLVGSR